MAAPVGGPGWSPPPTASSSATCRDSTATPAYLLSAGPGPNSRIYKTEDGGLNWQIQFINRDSSAFYDCFAFWDRKSGLAFSDNVGGKFPYVTTLDGGITWDHHTMMGPPRVRAPLPRAAPA